MEAYLIIIETKSMALHGNVLNRNVRITSTVFSNYHELFAVFIEEDTFDGLLNVDTFLKITKKPAIIVIIIILIKAFI